MIQLSVRGLAKYMTSRHATQLKILRDYKYPNDPEPHAMRLYYREARDCVEAFHRSNNNRPWLRGKAGDLNQMASLVSGPARARLRHNARALTQYEEHFGERHFEIGKPMRLYLDVDRVRISTAPELHVSEGSREKLIRLDFAAEQPSDDVIKIICQTTFSAAEAAGLGLPASSILHLDVARGRETRGARSGARVRADIEAACRGIAALWDSIEPRS